MSSYYFTNIIWQKLVLIYSMDSAMTIKMHQEHLCCHPKRLQKLEVHRLPLYHKSWNDLVLLKGLWMTLHHRTGNCLAESSVHSLDPKKIDRNDRYQITSCKVINNTLLQCSSRTTTSPWVKAGTSTGAWCKPFCGVEFCFQLDKAGIS